MVIIFKKNLWVIVLGTALAVYGWRAYTIPQPCAVPIEYSVGTLDPRFGVTREQLVADLAQASGIWEQALGGTDLFVYNPKATLRVNLVYDARQQATQQEQVLTSHINDGKLSAQAAMEQYKTLQAKYVAAAKNYTKAAADFNKAQEAYNARVAYYNAHGGASQKEYAALQATKASLQEQQQKLETQRKAVNRLADDANDLIDEYNLLVNHINANVRAINNDGLAGTEFEEGVYVSDKDGKRIDIYQFDNQTTFIRVLAHELGHALGLAHNDNPDSIMSPVNSGTNLDATPDDLAALKTLCKVAAQ